MYRDECVSLLSSEFSSTPFIVLLLCRLWVNIRWLQFHSMPRRKRVKIGLQIELFSSSAEQFHKNGYFKTPLNNIKNKIEIRCFLTFCPTSQQLCYFIKISALRNLLNKCVQGPPTFIERDHLNDIATNQSQTFLGNTQVYQIYSALTGLNQKKELMS